MTVGELRNELRVFPDDYEIYFSADPGLKFYRLNQRGDKRVQMEFAENVYKDTDGWHVDGGDET